VLMVIFTDWGAGDHGEQSGKKHTDVILDPPNVVPALLIPQNAGSCREAVNS
jgi:hypothetical protein